MEELAANETSGHDVPIGGGRFENDAVLVRLKNDVLKDEQQKSARLSKTYLVFVLGQHVELDTFQARLELCYVLDDAFQLVFFITAQSICAHLAIALLLVGGVLTPHRSVCLLDHFLFDYYYRETSLILLIGRNFLLFFGAK